MAERAALYARVSTARQEQEQTVASQVAALHKAAAELGLQVPPQHCYVDEGFSGTRLDRPAFDAMRDAAADGLLDVVLVFAPDRLARNYVHQQVVLEELAARGVRVHFVERPIGEKAEDKLLVQMQGVIAEYERAKIIERTRRGRLHKVRTGQTPPFSRPPYGYRLVTSPDGRQKTVVLHEEEAARVRDMYRWVLEEGLSARAVARRLTAQGVRPRRAARWTGASVRHLLVNPAFTGTAVYNRLMAAVPTHPRKAAALRKVAKSSYLLRPREQWQTWPIPPLVDEATQAAVKLQLARNKVLASRNVRYSYLLRLLVVCGQCGMRMSCFRRAQSNGRGDYHYYGCSRGPEDSGRAARCKAQYLRAEALDATVWSAVCQWLREPRILVEEVASWQERREGEEASARERARLESTCRNLERQVERLVDAYQQGALRVDELKVRRAQLEAALEAARSRAKELQSQHADEERLGEREAQLEAFAAAVREGLDALDFEGRQRLVRLLIERVVVTGEHVTIEHAVPLSGRFCRLRKNDERERPPQQWRLVHSRHPLLLRLLAGRCLRRHARLLRSCLGDQKWPQFRAWSEDAVEPR